MKNLATFDLGTGMGTGDDAQYAWDGTVLTVKNGAAITITGTVSGGRRIEVAQDAAAAITLDHVSITGLGENQSPLRLHVGAALALHLQGSNKLKAGANCAGIQAPGGTMLRIGGPGMLAATGGCGGAGIGGSECGGENAGAITIDGGTIVAKGHYQSGAGIGGGTGGATITIHGGVITAKGGNGCAGIGGGFGRTGGVIAIHGGVVTAKGGLDAAGIGGGSGGCDEGSKGGIITITGGTVAAQGGIRSAGIGGGFNREGGIITIEGSACVNATGGSEIFFDVGGGAGIGSGGSENDVPIAAGHIKIDTRHGATVAAQGGKGKGFWGDGAAIGQGGFFGHNGGDAGVVYVGTRPDVSQAMNCLANYPSDSLPLGH